MSKQAFDHIMDGVNALSPEQMRQLRDELDSKLASTVAVDQLALTPEELAEQELQRRLVAAGRAERNQAPTTVHARPRAFHAGFDRG